MSTSWMIVVAVVNAFGSVRRRTEPHCRLRIRL